MAGEIILAHGIWEVMRASRQMFPHHIGLYGPSLSGKTTLDKQLFTPGEVRPIPESQRTHHKKARIRNRYIMPEPTAKRIRSRGLKRTVISRDLGGHTEYHHMWLRDMFDRKVNTVIVVIDHRHMLDSNNTENQVAFGYLVESLKNGKRPKHLSLWKRWRRRKYAPHRIILLANKADVWLNDEASFDMWQRGTVVKHPIFDAFREHLYSLQELGIPTRVDACSAVVGWNVEEAIMRGIEDT
jgi:hypothetical protein